MNHLLATMLFVLPSTSHGDKKITQGWLPYLPQTTIKTPDNQMDKVFGCIFSFETHIVLTNGFNNSFNNNGVDTLYGFVFLSNDHSKVHEIQKSRFI